MDAELWLYGVVGGFWFGFDADDVSRALRAAGDAEQVTVRLHSPGGDALEGIAIANLFRNHPAHVRVVVDGLASSAASVIAMGGDEVVMSPGSEMFLHEPWMLVVGNAYELEGNAAILEKQGANLARLYARRAGGTAGEWREVMQADPDGTWFTDTEAVEAGLADDVATITALPGATAPEPAEPDDEHEHDHAAAARDLARDLSLIHPAARTAAAATWPYLQEDTMRNRTLPVAMSRRDTAEDPDVDDVDDVDELEDEDLEDDVDELDDDQTDDDDGGEDDGDQRASARGRSGRPAAGLRQSMRPARGRTRSAARDARRWAAAAASAMRGATDAAQVNAALADVTPGNAGTDGIFPRPAWLGELWTPQAQSRPLVEAIGVSPLTSMHMDGWRWDTPPEVDAYAGEKAEVPTNEVVIVPDSADAQRIAGGWDIDRIYMDFNTGFMEAFQRAALVDYRKKSQKFLIDGHAAIAGPPPIPAYPSIWSQGSTLPEVPNTLYAVEAIVSFLVGNGADVDFIFMSGDLFSELLQLTSSEAPWWLTAGSLGSLNGDGDLAGTTFAVDPDLSARTVAGGDRDAVSLWETGPINVTAINLPNGGIDFGLFGYYANMVHDARGLVTTTVAVPAPEALTAAAKKKS